MSGPIRSCCSPASTAAMRLAIGVAVARKPIVGRPTSIRSAIRSIISP